jgi:hypothetical protein
MDSITETTTSKPKTSIALGAVWMVAITLVLFWLPLLNGFLGGLVGGYKVGGIKRALLAALLPAAIVTVALSVFLIALDLPIVGLVAGLTGGALVIIADLGLFLGAAIGGAASARSIASAQH